MSILDYLNESLDLGDLETFDENEALLGTAGSGILVARDGDKLCLVLEDADLGGSMLQPGEAPYWNIFDLHPRDLPFFRAIVAHLEGL